MDRAGLVNAGDTAVIAGVNAAFSAVGDATSRQVIFSSMTRTAREGRKDPAATGAGSCRPIWARWAFDGRSAGADFA